LKKILAIVLFLTASSQSFTPDYSKYAQFGLCMWPLLKQTAEFFSIDERLNSTHGDASPEIAAFIHELLEQHGVKNAQKVIIKLGKEYCSGNNLMMIEWLNENSEYSLLESLIMQYNSLDNSQESDALLMLIYQQIGSIEHEISHIKHHDGKKRAISLATFSLASWTCTKLLEYQMPLWYPGLKKIIDTADWKSKFAYNICSGFLLGLLNKQIVYKICRNQERAADAAISDNASILLAKVNLHTTIYETDKQQVEKQYGKLVSWLCQKIPSLYLFFDWEHPTSYERAKTFAHRLVKILNHERRLDTAFAEGEL
jgi:hypothetical protein